VHGGVNTGHLQERLHLRGEEERVSDDSVEERPHAHAVAGEEHAPASGVPDGEGEIAVEVSEAVRPLLVIQMEDDFGVAGRAKDTAPGDEPLAKLDIVENLAIEGDHKPAAVERHGLLAVGE